MDSNNRGAGRTVTCSAPEKLDCVLPGLLAVGAVWVLCGACGRVQVIWCYGYVHTTGGSGIPAGGISLLIVRPGLR